MHLFSVMHRCVLIFVGASLLAGADDPKLALALKAQSEFDRVSLAATPDLRDTMSCIQTQASLLAVALPEERSLVLYHKGYCTLASALITQNPTEFTGAAADFDKAIESWPARVQHADKKKPPEPITSALYVLSAVANLKAGWDEAALDKAQAQLASAVESSSCASNIMPQASCADILKVGKQWLGWMALRHSFLDDAAHYFIDSTGTGWPEWVSGLKEFQARRYSEAASDYGRAISLAKREDTSFAGRLAPRHDRPSELTELGGAQLLAGNTSAAIAVLDEAVKANPANARALFFRARAKELGKQQEAALADYNLASRTAFANAKDLASGEAHLYRGIMLYRRKDYSHAEDEFASALNFDIAADLHNDAAAWRHLAAVAGGSCAAARQQLARSLTAVSPFFPRDEAQVLMSSCPGTATGSPPGWQQN
jgi:tetratricopeptide (TPR) repeat protein